MEQTQIISGNLCNRLSSSGFREFLATIERHAETSCPCGHEGKYVPQTKFMSQKWDSVNNVPVGTLIYFSTSANRGVLISDALEHKFSDMMGNNDIVFEDITAATCALGINWPGYSIRKYEIKTRIGSSAKDANPVTRERLGFDIAKRVQTYLKEMRSVSIDKTNAQWQLGRGCISVNRIMLVSVERMSQGTWQPHLHVINRDM